MKKYIITLVMLLMFSLTVFAKDITTIVNPGSDNGAYKAVLIMLGDKIEHNFIQANNPIIASKYFNKKNILTMWSTEWPGDESIPSVVIDENTLVAVQAYETILCSRTYNSISDMKGKTIKIATWGDSPSIEKFIDSLGTSNNINFEIVPYGGSGDTVRGYLGKDADTIFTIQTKQSKVEADGKCIAFSANGDLDFAFIDIILSVNAENGAIEKFRNVVLELSTTEAWQTAFAGTATYVLDNDNKNSLVNKVNAAIELNSN
jgi:hypothetical protein|tara:strand:+ start:116 stop:898 length:783 start_codon:yes stop_codon:yes gene_type:complete